MSDSSGLIEQIGVCVDFITSENANLIQIRVYFFVSYIPPYEDNAIYKVLMNNINSIVKNLDSTSYAVVLGDFNLSDVKWIFSEEDKCVLPFNVVKVIGTMSAMNFYQVNEVCTSTRRILDLVFINEELEASVTEADYPLLINSIYHNALQISFNFCILNPFSGLYCNK